MKAFYKQIYGGDEVGPTIVVGNPKAPFSIVVGEGTNPFPGFVLLTLDLHLLMLSIKQVGIKLLFLSFWFD